MILGVNLLINHVFIINCIQLVKRLPLTVGLKIITNQYLQENLSMAQPIPHHDIEEVRGGDDLVPLPRQHLLSLQTSVEVREEIGVVLQIIMSQKCWWEDLHIEINVTVYCLPLDQPNFDRLSRSLCLVAPSRVPLF